MRLHRGPLTAIVTTVLSAAMIAAGITACATTAPAADASAKLSGSTAQPASAAARVAVPWDRVGSGWVLTQYSSAAPEGGGSGPVALYLISPGGTRYQLAHWRDARSAPQLVAWSPDGRRALFQVFTGHGGVEQLTLATGRMSTFTLPGNVTPIGYTTPRGLNIVASRPAGSVTSLARYSLSGQLARALGSSADGQVLYAADGTRFVTGTGHGVKLVSNGGALIKNLPVPWTSANTCNPARWWNDGTVVVSCWPPGSSIARLWLVPVSGARPTALTPPHRESTGDLGDLDAWRLASGLYLQSAGPCGVLQIFRQARNGSITRVTVPHTMGDNHVLTARGSRLLIQAPDQLHGQRLAAVVRPRDAGRAVADPGARPPGRRHHRHPVLQPGERQPLTCKSASPLIVDHYLRKTGGRSPQR